MPSKPSAVKFFVVVIALTITFVCLMHWADVQNQKVDAAKENDEPFHSKSEAQREYERRQLAKYAQELYNSEHPQ